MRVVLLWTLFPTARTWGAPLPCTPSGDGCERVTTLSRSPGGCSGVDLGSRRCGLFFCGRCFRWRGRGALRSPTSPRVTGCERAAALSRSPGGCSGADFGSRRCGLFSCGRCFRRCGRGARCSPTPPRGRGARGLRPSRALPGAVLLRAWFPTMRAILLRDFVFDGAGRGALRSPTSPRGTGCERVHTLSRSPGGCSDGGILDLMGTEWFSMEEEKSGDALGGLRAGVRMKTGFVAIIT